MYLLGPQDNHLKVINLHALMILCHGNLTDEGVSDMLNIKQISFYVG